MQFFSTLMGQEGWRVFDDPSIRRHQSLACQFSGDDVWRKRQVAVENQ